MGADLAGVGSDRLAIDADEPAGLADADSLGQVVDHGDRLVLRRLQSELRNATILCLKQHAHSECSDLGQHVRKISFLA